MKNAVCFLTVLISAMLLGSCYRDTPPDGTYEGNIEVLNNNRYAPRVCELIRNSRSSILVVMYAAKVDPSDPKDPVNGIFAALSEAAGRGVAVKILLDNVTAMDYPATTNYLISKGIPFKVDPAGVTTHSKILIVDEMFTVVGSHNWTESAALYNNETSVVLRTEDLAKAEKSYFYSLYDKY